jgi:predicted HTH transcriptional regulator
MALPAFPDVSMDTIFPLFESSWMEFKLSTQQIPKIREAICAFLNSSGGYLVLGVRDDRHMVGVDLAKHLDVLLRNVDDIYHQKIILKDDGTLLAPGTLSVDTVPIANGKHLIIVKVVPEKDASYTMGGEKIVRLNASNYRVTQEKYLPESLVKAKIAGEVQQVVGTLFEDLEKKYKAENDRLRSKIKTMQDESKVFTGIAKAATESAKSMSEQLREVEAFQKTLFDTILKQKEEVEKQLGVEVHPWWKRLCC